MTSRVYHFKDNLIEALDKFERETSLSPNVIVENFLENFLYEKGYLIYDIDEKDIQTPDDLMKESGYNFHKKRINGKKVQVYCNNLYFGVVPSENYYDRIDKLAQFSIEELKEISKNNWDNSNGTYNKFLKLKLDNPHFSVDKCIKVMKFCFHRRDKGWQIKHDKFTICSCHDEELNEIKNYLFDLSETEINQLKHDLKNYKINRKKVVLKKLESKKSKVEK